MNLVIPFMALSAQLFAWFLTKPANLQFVQIERMFFFLLYERYRRCQKPVTERIAGVKEPEPEFLNIHWMLKSQLFKESCLFKGQSVQQGLQWLGCNFFMLIVKSILCKQLYLYKKIILNDSALAFSIENICRIIWKPCSNTISSTIISKCLRIRALVLHVFSSTPVWRS